MQDRLEQMVSECSGFCVEVYTLMFKGDQSCEVTCSLLGILL